MVTCLQTAQFGAASEYAIMETPPYTPPVIVDLGDALVLTKGSYPSKPETFGTIDQVSDLSRDLETLDD